MKLFLYSSWLMSAQQRIALSKLVGKDAGSITVAAITNAIDVVEDAKGWVGQSLESLGCQIEEVDLRNWLGNPSGLLRKLASKDVIWVCAGNGFYLRWILRESKADVVIKELVSQGKVYAGWGGGGVVAGPTLQFFEGGEDLTVVPEVVTDGIHLTDIVIVPHMDLGEFSEDMKKINQNLTRAGFSTVPLNEAQALVIDGDKQQLI